MKKLILIFIAMLVVSCNKMDCNGKLDGFWQLRSWEDASGTPVHDEQSMIYWGVKLQLIQLQNLANGKRYNCKFQHRGDSLLLTEIFSYPGDKPVTMPDSALSADFGIPSDGRFYISLSSRTMILKSNTSTMHFTKR